MKTTKILTALILVLVIAATSFANVIGTVKIQTNNVVNGGIRYQVNVMIDNEKELCNIYLVEVRDELGRLVAPGQVYISGKTTYNFFERGPANGVRIARLVRAEFGDRYVCEYELFTKAVLLKGTFESGQTYRFDLFPELQPIKE